jgi:glycosyltransferase involved in cell wall biosynthesis
VTAPADKESVGVDATLWDEPTTGIGLYTRELTSALERLGHSLLRFGAGSSGDSPRGSTGRTAWTIGRLPAALDRAGVGLYHAYGNFNLPLVKPEGMRFVLTVHDVIPDLFPETVSLPFRWQFRLWLRRSLQIADRIICVSAKTRDDIEARFGLPRERVAVVYNGVDHVLAASDPARVTATIQALELPRQFVLFAGAWDARKNVLGVMEAWHRLPEASRLPLLLVGQPWFGSRPTSRRLSAMQAGGARIRSLGFQEAPVLYEIMRRATIFVFPSFYEGFGLPPLEAMRLGTPTIISTAGALPEVCGDAAMAVPPSDTAALTAAMARLLSSREERESRRAAGEQWARAFTWDRAARETRTVYEQLLTEGSAPRANLRA